jgi:hypothetical protein
VAQCLERSRHVLWQDADHLADGAGDRIVAMRPAMRLEHGHDQAQRLARGEHQRREPQPAPDAIAAVRAADRLDRHAGLPKDRHVAPRGALGDAEPVTEPLGGDARAPLEQLEGEQRPGGGAGIFVHERTLADVPAGKRPEWFLPLSHDYLC